jgi:hypothetical protein
MNKWIRFLAALATLASTGAWAQQSTYQNGTLTIPSVQVGADTYSATLAVINASPLTLQLTGASLQSPPQQTTNVFNAATGKVTLPQVLVVGAGVYTNVELTLQAGPGPLKFIVTAATAPTQSSGAASACLDPAYLATGTHWVLSYHTLTGSTETSTYNTDILITGPQTFNSQSAIESQSTTNILTGQAAGTTAQAWSYFAIQGLDLLILGNKVNASFSGFGSQTVTTFNPPPVWRYSLNAGESFTTNWIATATTTITGSPIPIPPTTSTYPGSDTYTFLGFEDVTVPAGAFAGACKWTHTFTQALTVNGQTTTTSTTVTQWNTRKGALVKSLNGTDTIELTAGTVNGGAVGP